MMEKMMIKRTFTAALIMVALLGLLLEPEQASAQDVESMEDKGLTGARRQFLYGIR